MACRSLRVPGHGWQVPGVPAGRDLDSQPVRLQLRVQGRALRILPVHPYVSAWLPYLTIPRNIVHPCVKGFPCYFYRVINQREISRLLFQHFVTPEHK